jgi:hypothetical protein
LMLFTLIVKRLVFCRTSYFDVEGLSWRIEIPFFPEM